MNEYLRESPRRPFNMAVPGDRKINKTIQSIDSALRRCEAPEDAVVYRGLAMSPSDLVIFLNAIILLQHAEINSTFL